MVGVLICPDPPPPPSPNLLPKFSWQQPKWLTNQKNKVPWNMRTLRLVRSEEPFGVGWHAAAHLDVYMHFLWIGDDLWWHSFWNFACWFQQIIHCCVLHILPLGYKHVFKSIHPCCTASHYQVVAASVRPHVMSFNLSIEVKKSLFVK